jgi:hypothetical protein
MKRFMFTVRLPRNREKQSSNRGTTCRMLSQRRRETSVPGSVISEIIRTTSVFLHRSPRTLWTFICSLRTRGRRAHRSSMLVPLQPLAPYLLPQSESTLEPRSEGCVSCLRSESNMLYQGLRDPENVCIAYRSIVFELGNRLSSYEFQTRRC